MRAVIEADQFGREAERVGGDEQFADSAILVAELTIRPCRHAGEGRDDPAERAAVRDGHDRLTWMALDDPLNGCHSAFAQLEMTLATRPGDHDALIINLA